MPHDDGDAHVMRKPPDSVRNTTLPPGSGVRSSLMICGASTNPMAAPMTTAAMLMAMRRRSSPR